MLGSISFTWIDIIIILMMLAAPVVVGVVILFLLIKSIYHSDVRTLFLWLVLPQVLATLILWWMLDFYNIYISFSIFPIASGAMLGGMAISYLFFKLEIPVSYRLLFGHIASLALFFIVINSTNPNLHTELQAGRDRHQLLNLGQRNGSGSFNLRLEDDNFRQEMLVEAVKNSNMPEATFRELLSRGADPFRTYAFNGSIFSTAVEHHNINALRVFTEKLVGDDKQAENNRAFLRAHNPLDQTFYFSVTPTEKQKNNIWMSQKLSSIRCHHS